MHRMLPDRDHSFSEPEISKSAIKKSPEHRSKSKSGASESGFMIPGKTPRAYIPRTGDALPVSVPEKFCPKLHPWCAVSLDYDTKNHQYLVSAVKNYPVRQFPGIAGIYSIKKNTDVSKDTVGTFRVFHAASVSQITTQKEELFSTLDIPSDFSARALKETEALPERVSYNPDNGRRDLRHLPFITVDGKDAKDFDDAIYAEPLKEGWQLYIAVADVAEYITEDSVLDKESQLRGNSYYLAKDVFPMLPEKLSNHLCSLKPDVNRNVMICEVTTDKTGTPLKTDIYPAIIKSAARVTYEEADIGFETGKWRTALIDMGIDRRLSMYKKIAYTLKQKRIRRGMIEFRFPEYYIEFTPDRQVEDIRTAYQTPAMELIEHFMLEANEAVAEFGLKHRIPLLFRNHAKPNTVRYSCCQPRWNIWVSR
ncbi:hypothetical protein CHS0354_001954 [Potamilus streckersoni]|uniref:RNB domain-containing protein n=1 Tax=Potamilus streckersoni TaxID=2493646 RepID=A0AAE0T5H8_9BIVA|nr:hypothetical protein CHS0354_001954 [Potamilus streckersoni]